MSVWSALALLTVFAWLGLLIGRQGFWQAVPRLPKTANVPHSLPPIAIIVPARNEAETIELAVRSLLSQDYTGFLHLIVVDDRSSDETAAIVRKLIPDAGPGRRLTCITNSERPAGWSGKLWAIKGGLDHLETGAKAPNFLLLTDADIAHDPANLSELFKKMVNEKLDLVSVMVKLRNQSFWERFLIPPFVFFFQMLYPFNAVNRSEKALAAAAGGCVLLRRDALNDAGGIEAIRGALIDDVALGRLIKSRPNGRRRIWLGHAERTVSLRAYESLWPIWSMVVRTADTQLNHSLLNLLGTVAGMVLIYLLPPLAALTWPLHQDSPAALLGLASWLLMAIAYLPTLRLYRSSILWAPTLPLAALFYTIMTLDSARRHRQGKGGVWKGRAFQG